MAERQNISSLFGLAVTIRAPVPHELDSVNPNDLVIARKDNGAIIATVDRDGNRFYGDA